MEDCKECTKCKQLKPLTQEYWGREKVLKKGIVIRYRFISVCKKCINSYSRSKHNSSAEYREYHCEKGKAHHREIRKRVLEYYSKGTMQCACCAETNLEFLCLDHINGEGGKQRKILGSNQAVYRWIIKNNFPEGFRILCHNCNQSLGAYGYCPHNKT